MNLRGDLSEHPPPDGSPRPAGLLTGADRRFTVMVLGVCALLLSPVLTYRMGLDQGTLAYVGAELLEGRWPYLSTWDHQFPGGMVLHAAQIFLLGRSVTMFRLFDLLYQLGSVYLIYRITRQLAGRTGAYVSAAIYALIYQGYGPWNTGQREGFALLFILLGFWLYLTRDRRAPRWTAAAIGLGLGTAALFKPTLLAFALIYLPLARRATRSTWPLLGVAAATAVLPGTVIAAGYWSLGGLTQMYEACVAYQLQVYVHRLRGSDPLWVFWLNQVSHLGWQSAGLGLAYPPFLLWGPARQERRMVFAGYVAALLSVLVQGTFAGYHYLPGLGLGAILIGTMFSQLVTAWGPTPTLRVFRWRLGAPLLIAHLLIIAAVPHYVRPRRLRNLVTLQFLQPPRPGEFTNGTVFDFTEDWNVARYLAARTASTDRIQVWGHESLVYYLADRDAASRFQSSNALVMRRPQQDITPMQRAWRDEFLRDLAAWRPAYVAVVTGDNWWWAPEQRTSEQLVDDFPAFKSILQDHYVVDREIGRFRVYQRRAAREDGA